MTTTLFSPESVELNTESQDPAYFAVSVPKLIVLHFCTFGLYQLYWFYRNWVREQDENRHETFSPVLRTVFTVVFAYSLFARIQTRATVAGLNAFAAFTMAVAFVVLTMCHKLPDAWSLVAFFAVIPLVVVQRTVNALNRQERPRAPLNHRLTWLNWCAIVIGGPLFLLGVVGLLLGNIE